MSRLALIPIRLAEANAFVARLHRHHKLVAGHKFSLGAVLDGRLVCVAIVGRPVSRMRDDGVTLAFASVTPGWGRIGYPYRLAAYTAAPASAPRPGCPVTR